MNRQKFALFACAAALGLPSVAQPSCDARAQAEVDAVTRDFAARSPGKGTGPAQQRWSKELHEALQAVEQRHEACRKSNTPAPTAAQTQRLESCLDANRREFDAMDQRYQGRTLSLQEQTQWRTEQQKLLDARNACTRQK